MKKYSMKAAKRGKTAFRTPSNFKGRFIREKFAISERMVNNSRIKFFNKRAGE